MTAKTVWGIVLIVLGVLAVLSGFSQIGEAEALGQTINGFLKNFDGANAKHFQQTIRQVQFAGMVKVLIGIGLAAWGTWMLNDSNSESAELSNNIGVQQEFSSSDEFELGEIPESEPNHYQSRMLLQAVVSEKCPECGTRMNLRVVTKGNSAGKRFWICPSYPECRSIQKFSGEDSFS